MKKFVIYKCAKCFKEKTIDNSISNIFIDLCTLTENCDGRLSPISEKSLIDISNSLYSPIIGKAISNETITEKFYNLTTNNNLELAIAVNSTEPFIDVKFTVNKENDVTYTEFYYVLNNVTDEITGQDSSVGKRVLTFKITDTVKVIVNGEEKLDGLDYRLAYSNNTGYKILFSDSLNVNAIVRILVYSESLTEEKTLRFFPSDGYLNSSWSNVRKVKIKDYGQTLLNVYVCRDLDSTQNLILKGQDQPGVFLTVGNFYGIIGRKFDKVVPIKNTIIKNNGNSVVYNEKSIQWLTQPIIIIEVVYADQEVLVDQVISFEDVPQSPFILGEI